MSKSEDKLRRTSLSLRESLWRYLRKVAGAEDKSVSAKVVEILEEYRSSK